MIRHIPTTQAHIDEAIRLALPVYEGQLREVPPLDAASHSTIMFGRELLGVMYIHELYPGVAHVGMVLTTNIQNHPVSIVKFFRKLMEVKMPQHKCHRLQMEVMKGYTTGQRWATALGFIQEGIMRKFGPNQEDFILYARTL